MNAAHYIVYVSAGLTVASLFVELFATAEAAASLRQTFALSLSSFRIWSVVTSSFFEDSFLKSALCLAVSHKFISSLEVVWSTRSVIQYLFTTMIATSICIIPLLFVTGQSCYGQTGLLMASSIAYRHAVPTRPLLPLISDIIPTRLFQARHLPFIILCISILGYIIQPLHFADLPFVLSSFFTSWFYLRYYFHFKLAGVRGDHSTDFSFDVLFPRVTRPYISYITSHVFACACRFVPQLRLRSAEDDVLYDKGGDSSVEMRRQKALKYLEENITKLSQV